MQKSKARHAHPRRQRSRLRACGVLLAAAVLGACAALRPSAAAPSNAGLRGPGQPLYLARRKWHIDVGFALRDLGPGLAFMARRFPQAKYLFFGFGDRHYLLSRRKGSATLSGALLPGPGMILVTAIENTPGQAFGRTHVLEFDLSATEMAAAQAFVRGSLAGAQGATDLSSVAEGPYEGSLYYSAVPRYSALHTCNTWAAEALASAGLPVRTRVVFAGQLWKQARKIGAPLPPGSTEPPRLTPPPRPTPPQGVLAPADGPQSQGGGLPF